MAISDSTDFSVSAEEIARAALQQVRQISNHPPVINRHLMDMAMFRLNLILKSWVNDGLNLFSIEKGVVYLAEHKYLYKLGDKRSNSYLDSDLYKVVYNFNTKAVGSSVLDVPIDYASWAWGNPASITMKVTVIGDGDYNVSSVISSYSDNSTFTRLTLATDLSSYCADNSGAGYTARIEVLTNETITDVLEGEVNLIYNNASRDKTAMTRVGREGYENLSADTESGIPNTFYFRQNREDAEMFIWPVPDSTATYYSIEFNYQKLIDDIDARGNTVPVPITFAKAVHDELVSELATTFNLPVEERAFLWQVAKDSKEAALSYDKEKMSKKFHYA